MTASGAHLPEKSPSDRLSNKSSNTPLPEKFYEGITQFNRQEFFEAHDTLEIVWHARKTQDRFFIQGIIQIAVACHHLQNGNTVGAKSLFEQGIAKIKPFLPCYEGIDVEKLISSISKLQAQTHKADNVVAWPRIHVL